MRLSSNEIKVEFIFIFVQDFANVESKNFL